MIKNSRNPHGRVRPAPLQSLPLLAGGTWDSKNPANTPSTPSPCSSHRSMASPCLETGRMNPPGVSYQPPSSSFIPQDTPTSSLCPKLQILKSVVLCLLELKASHWPCIPSFCEISPHFLSLLTQPWPPLPSSHTVRHTLHITGPRHGFFVLLLSHCHLQIVLLSSPWKPWLWISIRLQPLFLPLQTSFSSTTPYSSFLEACSMSCFLSGIMLLAVNLGGFQYPDK